MKAFLSLLIIFLAGVAVQAQTAPRTSLKVGDKAPNFELPNGEGKVVKLSDYTSRGPVVVVFYRGYW